MKDENLRKEDITDVSPIGPEEGERLIQAAWLAYKVQLGLLKAPAASSPALRANSLANSAAPGRATGFPKLKLVDAVQR